MGYDYSEFRSSVPESEEFVPMKMMMSAVGGILSSVLEVYSGMHILLDTLLFVLEVD
ncbi:hypothetical protein BCV72DRAFT_228485 [Rhizopus microsporus var. microsporus]|uniref:Uncharacterized protein n=2 Tax=Rhizopus microsporus TaxID=58291 RepID=A0A2G4SKI8_RHIZD|nr:uncharacterized protein RHIMIDRAFT_263421 [Rhizopus microsporus ATCC 52813]ORE06276.1 hypothetical protein BCV72DRAFT_228485 [Rhizopus microsporus var. microsporus]PHZ09273.1 hypothetical protein RHIMIDRAFT_263421 [Rhizopus microsporus ATCC 52813]